MQKRSNDTLLACTVWKVGVPNSLSRKGSASPGKGTSYVTDPREPSVMHVVKTASCGGVKRLCGARMLTSHTVARM